MFILFCVIYLYIFILAFFFFLFHSTFKNSKYTYTIYV